mgnify:FL=1|jgi:ribonuclease R
MINSDGILEHMRQESYRPLSYTELVNVLGISGEEENKLNRILGRLEKEGEIVKTRKNKYGLPEKMNLIKGTIRLNQRGYGILMPDNCNYPEIFVYSGGLNGAMHSDKVMVRPSAGHNGGMRPEGEVIRVIKRANQQLVGTFERGKKKNQVIPDDNRHFYPVYVRPVRKIAVKDGDKVVVNITAWPGKDRALEGRIIEVLGHKGDPGLDLEVVIKKHGLRNEFPDAVLKEAQEVATSPTYEELSRRRDLRDLRMVTIDGEDAKDLDDAVSISRIQGGYRLGVHIADVSHYVREDSRLDREAFARGTSVYLIDKVLPMLPPELSNNICSLNANQERLAMSCIMDIDRVGQVQNYDICKSVIKIRERMSYALVNRILVDDDPEEKAKYKELLEDFYLMKELSDILRARRTAQGSLDFDFPESQVIVDENSFPVEIKRLDRGPGEMLIEDFMIKANEVVAEHIYRQQIPILYRVHEKPDEESITKLNLVLGGFGHKIKGKKIDPLIYQKILEDIKGRPEEQMISMLLLRSMRHARYAPEALGHFGLASQYYCHFTSPIRRYPDLVVHRALSALLDGSMNTKKRAALEKKMAKYGEQSTLQEIKAEEAERELLDIKKAQYMKKFVGEVFDARISSILAFGFFIELDNTVEGLVHISSITDDYYEFNDRNYTLVGRHSGRKFAIGDEVRAQLVRVDIDDAKIDFELAE